MSSKKTGKSAVRTTPKKTEPITTDPNSTKVMVGGKFVSLGEAQAEAAKTKKVSMGGKREIAIAQVLNRCLNLSIITPKEFRPFADEAKATTGMARAVNLGRLVKYGFIAKISTGKYALTELGVEKIKPVEVAPIVS